MSGLIAFFNPRQEEIVGEDPLSHAIEACLKGKEADETLVFSKMDEWAEVSIETPHDLIEYYQNLLTILLLRKFMGWDSQRGNEKLQALLKKGKTEGFWNTSQLQEGYRVFAFYLFDGRKESFPFKQLEKGAMLQESGVHCFERQVPQPMENGHLALICLYLGWVWQDDELLQKGLKLAEFCLSLCDHEGALFQGMWIKESDYKPSTLSPLFALLFTITSHLSFSSKIQVVCENLSEKLEMGNRDPLLVLLAYGFQQLIDKEVSYPKIHEGLTLHDFDRSLGFLRYQHKEMSLACSAMGVNTGLGVIHKKGVHIVSFGPHYAPLADSTCYGIFRPSNGSQEGFKDLLLEPGEENARFRGWTRVVSSGARHISKQSFSYTLPGDQWLFFDLKAEKERVDLSIRQSKFDEEAPLYFVFFVSSDEVHIGEEVTLFPKALERYQGRSDKILFKKNREEVAITPQFQGEMEVIPLAGKDHFWSAEFLLAFPMMEKMKSYSWSIE